MSLPSDLTSSLRARGAAVARVSVPQERVLLRAYRLARRFFERTSAANKQRCQFLSADAALGPAPVLIGYRHLQGTKELVRVLGKLPSQLPAALRRAIKEAQRVLDDLLMQGLIALLRNGGHHTSQRSLRRLCRGACPLDLFYYPNQPHCTEPTSPHVDRGYLHAIVASPSAGLELYEDGEWAAPHMIWPTLQPHADVIILANDALARLSREPGWQGGVIDACLHRVVNSTPHTARLSVSYELRPAFGRALDASEPRSGVPSH